MVDQDLIPDDFCFVHAADLHLGGRRWLRSDPASRALADCARFADRLALGRLVDLCIEERAALLLLAGDVIDGWCRDYSAGLVLVQELLRLQAAGCETILLLGNHDVRSRTLRSLLLPERAQLIGMDGPETRVISRLGVALHGWSDPSLGRGQDVAEHYPVPVPGLLNLGLLHTSAEGREGHARYAPCSRRTLRHQGYDYWALGHVHTREVVCTDPWIVFPGNLQARGPRETGPKGATLVRVRDGAISSVEHRPLDALRFETIVADVDWVERADDVLAAAHAALDRALSNADDRPLAARLVLRGLPGATYLLGLSPARRRAQLAAIRAGFAGDALLLDETWVDLGFDSGLWRVDDAADASPGSRSWGGTSVVE